MVTIAAAHSLWDDFSENQHYCHRKHDGCDRISKLHQTLVSVSMARRLGRADRGSLYPCKTGGQAQARAYLVNEDGQSFHGCCIH